MKNISLKLDDDIFAETEAISKDLDMARNRYINEAVARYNAEMKREILRTQIKRESEITRNESMEVLLDFEATED
jgi:predicted transcriptional regulator